MNKAIWINLNQNYRSIAGYAPKMSSMFGSKSLAHVTIAVLKQRSRANSSFFVLDQAVKNNRRQYLQRRDIKNILGSSVFLYIGMIYD